MIADVVSSAIAGTGVFHALGRLFVRKGVAASLNTVMMQNCIRRPDQCQERNISAPTNAS